MYRFRPVIIALIALAVPAVISAQSRGGGGQGPGQGSGQAPGQSGEQLQAELLDVHGAGSQRSDPKSGEASDYPDGHGPQGDVVRIENYVRAVRLVSDDDLPYPVAGTGQVTYWDNEEEITASEAARRFPGQDAANPGLTPSYTDNGDGTVTDNVTGLMWMKNPGTKLTSGQAESRLRYFHLAGYDDWRLPTVKELYSLIQFSGRDASIEMKGRPNPGDFEPFIDTDFFEFEYGDVRSGERIIDAQFLTDTRYVTTTMNGDATVFGVNFADGRIKGYPITDPRGTGKKFFVLYVRGSGDYGRNDFVDNGDGTITDRATGLMWMKEDAGGMDWQDALEWTDDLDFAGYDDWRLPDAKELQSIVDYRRSPDTTRSAAIDPVFEVSRIWNEEDTRDYPYYWTSTTHVDADDGGEFAVYIAFGEALGYMGSPEQIEPGGDRGSGMSGPPDGGRR